MTNHQQKTCMVKKLLTSWLFLWIITSVWINNKKKTFQHKKKLSYFIISYKCSNLISFSFWIIILSNNKFDIIMLYLNYHIKIFKCTHIHINSHLEEIFLNIVKFIRDWIKIKLKSNEKVNYEISTTKSWIFFGSKIIELVTLFVPSLKKKREKVCTDDKFTT